MRRRSLFRMSGRRAVARLALVLLCGLVVAVSGTRNAHADCRDLAARAERQFGIPAGILQAMALTESGIAGMAWPWTVNAGGRPFYLRNRAEAVTLAEAATRRYGEKIALGCMQVYMRYHGQRFRDVAQMLDPATNVHYAATFLVALRRESGSWVQAVRRYHASDPTAQRTYLCRVLTIRRDMGYQSTTAAMERLCAVHAASVR